MSEVMQPDAEMSELRKSVTSPRADQPKDVPCGSICIHHGGRAFRATAEHASIFLRQVQRIAAHGQAELVPLLHADGVELLFVTARTPLQVHDSRDRSFTVGHGAASAA